MTPQETFTAIAARISGIIDGGRNYMTFDTAFHGDSYNTLAHLVTQCRAVVADLKTFAADFQTSLPAPALAALNRFFALRGVQGLMADDNPPHTLKAALVLFPALATEMTYILGDRQAQLRILSERAFLHLKWSIAADTDEAAKWQKANATHETHCERLGALHLLQFGIYAFKADASKGRTDLVFAESLNLTEVARAAEGLVLTEWKRDKDAANVPKAFAAARNGADDYRDGPLAGLELAATRYLIVVSGPQADPRDIPADETVGGVLYRHINIAVTPRTTSQQSVRANPPAKSGRPKT
jgi:hypothetical protein